MFSQKDSLKMQFWALELLKITVLALDICLKVQFLAKLQDQYSKMTETFSQKATG